MRFRFSYFQKTTNPKFVLCFQQVLLALSASTYLQLKVIFLVFPCCLQQAFGCSGHEELQALLSSPWTLLPSIQAQFLKVQQPLQDLVVLLCSNSTFYLSFVQVLILLHLHQYWFLIELLSVLFASSFAQSMQPVSFIPKRFYKVLQHLLLSFFLPCSLLLLVRHFYPSYQQHFCCCHTALSMYDSRKVGFLQLNRPYFWQYLDPFLLRVYLNSLLYPQVYQSFN